MTVPEGSSLDRRFGNFKIGVSPSGKAPGFDPGIRRFESCHPSQFWVKQSSKSVAMKGE